MENMEWKSEGMKLDVKGVIHSSLQFGRIESSSFLCMRENKVSTHTLPEAPISNEFHVKLKEIDF